MWIRRSEFEKLVKRVGELEAAVTDVAVEVPCEPYECGVYPWVFTSHTRPMPWAKVVEALVRKAKLKYVPGTPETLV